MKKNYALFAALSCALIALGCTKEIDNPVHEGEVNPEDEQVTPKPTGKLITISATLADTKVTFEPLFPDDDHSKKPTGMAHKWEEGDKLLVVDASNESNQAEYTLSSGAGSKIGTFTGSDLGADSYNVTVIPASSPSSLETTQTQIEDGSTAHLKFVAGATGVTDLNDFTLSETSNIIGFIAKLPSHVAGTINQVEIVKSTDDFTTTSTLTINLGEEGDANNDDILEVYANIPAGWGIAANTKMLLKFKDTAPSSTHSVYTRYQEFDSAVTLTPGKFNGIRVNCVNTDKYAGKDDDGTSAHPYLIADKYQLNSVNSLATGGQTTYFKMIDNINMSGVSFNHINTNSGYTQAVNFDGNYKTISNLRADLFYVFKGSIQNLTLYGSSVGNKRGIFAEFCQGTGHTITNVDITGGSMAATSANGGALIGRINNGSGTTVTIKDCDVTNTTVSGAAQTGGLIGSAEATVVVNNCTVAKSGESTSSVTASGANCGGLIGQTTGTVTITDCTVSGTNVTGTGVVGGVVGYANANAAVTISGCKYIGGTVTASGQYVGGFVGSAGNVASTITNCQVESATINVNCTNDARGGGFAGIIHDQVTVKGCTVGTSTTKVTVNTKQPANTGTAQSPSYPVINAGGFVGVCYGTITKNDDTRSTAYAKITSNNTIGTPLKLGGFVGFHSGVIEYSDAIVDMTSLKGQHIGGFAGFVNTGNTTSPYNRYGKISHCTESGSVTGNNYTAGFAAYIEGASEISDCSSAGSVTAQSSCGGFIGACYSGTISSNSTTATVSCSGSNNGGFAGSILGGTFKGCSATGNVSSTGSGDGFGGFAGRMSSGSVSDNCVGGNSNSTVTATGRTKIGGFIGDMAGGSVSGSKSYGSVSGAQYIGGFFGVLSAATTITGNESNCVVTATSNYVGGFAGRIGGAVSCTSCEHKTGRVWSSLGTNAYAYIGGFAGYIGDTAEAFTGSISCCKVTSAKVDGEKYENGSAKSSGTYVGGFAGRIGSDTTADNTGKVEKCGVFNSGTGVFIGGAYLGGFAGRSDATIEKCRVNGGGQIYGYGNYIGGLIGYQAGHSVTYCYSTAYSSGNNKTHVGGLIGYATDCTIEECYAKGNVNTTGDGANADKRGGVIGILGTSVTLTRLIRWNDSNNATIVAGESKTPNGCYVKEKNDDDFSAKASVLGWSTNGTIWSYPSGGGIPSLFGV